VLDKQVLIEHFLGIEDHSRNYSINMVVEHIFVAHKGVSEIIKSLTDEEEVTREVSIEVVKPSHNENYLVQLKAFVVQYKEFVKSVENRNSQKTKAHPWFLKFNNRDWHIFLAIHSWVHKRQIKAIIRKLNK
jgi:hypothetical protein